MAGITTAAYSNLENGKTGDIKLSTLESIADGLGLKLDVTNESNKLQIAFCRKGK